MSFGHLPRALRTASFRLAIFYALLFAGSALILGSIVYWTVQTSLKRQMDERINAEIELLRQEFRSEGLQELIREIGERAAYFPVLDYLVVDDKGNRLAGNLPYMPSASGWTDIETEPRAPNPDAERSFHVRSVYLADGIRLAVADDLEPLEAIERAFLEALGIALLAFLVLSLTGGFVLSMGFLRQVDDITHTAEAIIRGELTSRIPLRETNDNFDRLSRTLNRMLDRIQDLMESLRQVSNDIAHALRTPLGRLRHKLETARLQIRSSPQGLAAVDAAIEETDTILDTFSALLRIAQIEAGTRKAGLKPLDLSALFERVIEAYAAAAEEEGKTLKANVETGLSAVGDRELLVEMAANLLDNAIRHTPAGADIELSLVRKGKKLIASIADNGPGIPAEDRERVFRRFYRLERSASIPGTGLGLALVAAVAELHGIELGAEDNAPGLRIRMIFDAFEPDELRTSTGYVMAINPGARPL